MRRTWDNQNQHSAMHSARSAAYRGTASARSNFKPNKPNAALLPSVSLSISRSAATRCRALVTHLQAKYAPGGDQCPCVVLASIHHPFLMALTTGKYRSVLSCKLLSGVVLVVSPAQDGATTKDRRRQRRTATGDGNGGDGRTRWRRRVLILLV